MVRQHPRHLGRKIAAGALVVLAIVLVVGLRTDMPGGDFARAACHDLAESAEPSGGDAGGVEEELTQAVARADRAAATDSSFEALHAGLRTLREAVMAEELRPRDEQAASNALSRVVRTCQGLTPGGSGGVRLADLTVQDLRVMRMGRSGGEEMVLGSPDRAA